MIFAKQIKIVMKGFDPRSNTRRQGIHKIDIYSQD